MYYKISLPFRFHDARSSNRVNISPRLRPGPRVRGAGKPRLLVTQWSRPRLVDRGTVSLVSNPHVPHYPTNRGGPRISRGYRLRLAVRSDTGSARCPRNL